MPVPCTVRRTREDPGAVTGPNSLRAKVKLMRNLIVFQANGKRRVIHVYDDTPGRYRAQALEVELAQVVYDYLATLPGVEHEYSRPDGDFPQPLPAKSSSQK